MVFGTRNFVSFVSIRSHLCRLITSIRNQQTDLARCVSSRDFAACALRDVDNDHASLAGLAQQVKDILARVRAVSSAVRLQHHALHRRLQERGHLQARSTQGLTYAAINFSDPSDINRHRCRIFLTHILTVLAVMLGKKRSRPTSLHMFSWILNALLCDGR